VPKFRGRESFRGATYHTGRWPHEGVDFSGQRVGVIGTGSSAIQSIPIIAAEAAHLFVFQRTPNFSVPARNAPLDPDFERQVKAGYADFRRQARESRVGFVVERSEASALAVTQEERRREYEKRWGRGGLGFTATYVDLLLDKDANDTAAEFCREKIRAAVHDPEIAEILLPKDYPVGTKRMCVDTGYYETFNRDNVTLVDIRRAPIEAITPDGLRTREAAYALDSLVVATGFDAMTGPLLATDIRGRGRRTRGVGRPRQRNRPRHALSARQFLVHGRQHSGQATRLHALHRRSRRLSADLRRRGGQGVRGVHPGSRVVGELRMEFHVTPAQKDLQHRARWLAADFATRAAQHDRDASDPVENYAALRDAGFYGLNVPADLGGSGVGLLGWSLAAEE